MDPFTGMAIAQGVSGATSALQNLTQKSGQWSKQYTKDEGQRQGQQQLLQQGLNQVNNPYQGFEPIADQARTQFNTQTIPSIANRFTNMGEGAQRSSAFQGALGAAGSQFEQGLAAMKSQYGFQNRAQGAQLAGQGLESNFENNYTAGGPSWLSSLFGGASAGASKIGEGYTGQFMNQPMTNAVKNQKPAQINQTQQFIQQRQAQQRANPVDSMDPMQRGY